MGVFKGYQPNIFRAVSGSLFSTTANWSRGYVPTGSDVATIADNCVINVSRTLGSLIVQPGFTASINTGLTLNVSSSFDIQGHFSCSGNPNINLSGKYNRINGMNPGTSKFLYRGLIEQLLPGGPYYNLECSFFDGVSLIGYISNKKVTSNLVINGTHTLTYGTVELGQYDYYCSGSTLINGGLYATLSKTQPGNIVYNGVLKNTAAGYPNNFINFSNGNPTIEVRNGIDLYQYNVVNTGKGTWRFTTNNQNIYNTAGSTTITFDAPIAIENVALSVLTNASTVTLNDVINGTTPTSQLINSGTINFNSVASMNSMTTGSFDYTSSNNTIGFTGNYSATMPSRFNTFRNLTISNTGIKTLGTSSYVSGTLAINSPATLELSSSNLYVSGTTQNSLGLLSKSGPGNITFNGMLVCNGGLINFSGNPTVNFLGSAYLNNISSTFNTGTGSWNFISSSQYIDIRSTFKNFSSSISVGPGLTLSLISTTNNSGMVAFNSINGQDAASKFIVGNNAYLYFGNTASFNNSFLTGSYDFNSSASNVWFGGNYTATIPSRFSSSFYNLGISGTGIKKLGSNTYVSGALTFPNDSIGGSLELSSSNLTVSGSTGIPQYSNFTKSGPGNITFIGLLTIATGIANTPNIDFSLGNPTVEVRNGMNGGGTSITPTSSIEMFVLGDTLLSGSVIITGSLFMSPSSSFVLPLSASSAPQTGSAYWSGSLLFIWNGDRYMSSSFA